MAPKTVTTLELPKPGQNYKEDDAIETEKYEITTKTTVKMLKDRLEIYGLLREGKRDVLIGRLEEFANDRHAWRSLFQPQAKRKRGSQTGKRKESHSAKRIAVMFCHDEDQSIPHQYRFEGSHRQIPPGRTQFQETQLDNWTDCALAACGDASRWQESWSIENQCQAAERAAKLAELPASQQSELGKVSAVEGVELSGDRGYSDVRMRRMSLRLNHIDDAVHNKLDQVLQMQHLIVGTTGGPGINSQPTHHAYHAAAPSADFDMMAPHPRAMHFSTPDRMVFASVTPEPSPFLPAVPPPSLPAILPPSSPLTASPPAAASPPAGVSEASSEDTVTLELGGSTLTFDRRCIPDPPAQHFSDQISKLFSEWDTGTLLKISGQPIPLKYWPKIYQDRVGVKRGVWNAFKVEFANWKYLVEEKERLGSEQAFWARYSKEDGTPLCYQHILNRLKRAREEQNRADADSAREYFGKNLQREDAKGAFEYTKKGKRMVFVKDRAIAEAWRGLLARDPLVAVKWAAMQKGDVETPDIVDLLTSAGIQLLPLSNHLTDNI